MSEHCVPSATTQEQSAQKAHHNMSCSGLMWRTALHKVLQDCHMLVSLQAINAKELRNDQNVSRDKEKRNMMELLPILKFCIPHCLVK